MDLILHLGAHRTGSTAFEKTLSHNADVLAQDGVEIWPPKRLRALHEFPRICEAQARLLAGKPEPAARDIALTRDLLERDLSVAAQAGRKVVLISEENMLGTMRRNLRERSLYATAPQRLQIYADLLPQAPVRVVLGTRSYGDYWRSAYLYVLRRRALPDFAELADDLALQTRSWSDLLRAMRAAFEQAELCVWAQEDLSGKELEIAAQVLARPQGAQGLQPLQRRINKGLAPADIPLIMRARNHQPDIKDKALDDRLKRMRRNHPDVQAPILFNAAQEQHMAQLYAEDLAGFDSGLEGVRRLAA